MVRATWDYYNEFGRNALPWRKKQTPYYVLVSEIMLQQTQVDRVIPKYKSFMRRFPTVKSLASAPLADVLTAWQGLGYNRRAKFLHEAAGQVSATNNGRFPRTYDKLRLLPGVGEYTAAAIMVFAYNEPVAMIETNIRQVYIHHFFKNHTNVTDKDILHLVQKTLQKDRPRDWFAALMDYGSYLKQKHGNVSSQSRQYKKQSKFTGSNRQVRGAIVRALAESDGQSINQLMKRLSAFESQTLKTQLCNLMSEGLVTSRDGKYYLG